MSPVFGVAAAAAPAFARASRPVSFAAASRPVSFAAASRIVGFAAAGFAPARLPAPCCSARRGASPFLFALRLAATAKMAMPVTSRFPLGGGLAPGFCLVPVFVALVFGLSFG
jgi:hypothetical protein